MELFQLTRRRVLAIGLALSLGAAAGYALLERRSAGNLDAAQTGSASGYPRPGPGLNLLALEASPYLQLHAHNPVDWYPWDERAFARARAEGKIVFLSVGYSTCYWCHVMEREVFSNPAIAALMNEQVISIKVDREERPDIDEIYMTATQILTGSGGWPNSVFLTPEARPFYAGTYFPAEDRRGRPGFPKLLRSLQEIWASKRDAVESTAARVSEELERLSSPGAAAPDVLAAPDALRDALAALRADFDAEQGGFGRGTKFPRPPVLDLLLVRLEQASDPQSEEMLLRTLDAMALGGIYDQLGGGFHRYATERSWSIPHFEKMLYDNAQLAGIYARAFALSRRPLYRRVVEQTVAYLDREMSHPEGGFFSAQDAEVEGEEGASYVWSQREIVDVLGDASAARFFEVYELTPLPGDPGYGVLRARPLLAEILEKPASDADPRLGEIDQMRAALLAERATRTQPRRDDKVLAAWNGLAIRGLVEAAHALERPDYLQRAGRAARFVLARLGSDDGSLRRSYIAGQAREEGVLDDYASLADGLLALHQATGDAAWRTASERLVDVMLARFEDRIGGGFYLTPTGLQLLVRPKPFEDNEAPSGNAQALRVLQALAAGPDPKGYARAAERTAAAGSVLLRRAPGAAPATVAVLARAPDRSHGLVADDATTPAGDSRIPGLPRSRDHVRAQLDGRGPALVVRVTVDPGWHVNANPASLPYLIPTSVEIPPGIDAARVRYPEGRSFLPAFSQTALEVYEGTIEIEVELGAELAAAERLALRFQACDTSRCLPPDRTELVIDRSAATAP